MMEKDIGNFGITRMKSDNDLLDQLIRKFNDVISVVDIKPHITNMRLALSIVESIYMNFSIKIKDDKKKVIEEKIDVLRKDFQLLLTRPTAEQNNWSNFFDIITRIKETFRIMREELK